MSASTGRRSAIIEQQTVRLSRIVDDMFTLARADAGNYPVRRTPMYLDEVVDEVVRAARVLASPKDVSIEPVTDTVRGVQRRRRSDSAPDRQPAGQCDPARPARQHGARRTRADTATGMPSPSAIRGQASPQTSSRTFSSGSIGAMRARRGQSDGGAGLGLALARWIANVHGGDVTLARSSEAGTTFTVSLPAPQPS